MSEKIKFNIGDVVFLKTDCDQLPRIITGILIRPTSFLYYLSNSTNETSHYEIEFSNEINETIKLF